MSVPLKITLYLIRSMFVVFCLFVETYLEDLCIFYLLLCIIHTISGSDLPQFVFGELENKLE